MQFSYSLMGHLNFSIIEGSSEHVLFLQPLVDVERVIAVAKRPVEEMLPDQGRDARKGTTQQEEDAFWPR